MKLFSTLALLFSSAITASAAMLDLGTAAGYTPYDNYMRPVRTVLSSLEGQGTDMARVQSLMKQGRNFRYSFTDPYTAAMPSETASRRAGDCKAKSLWLAEQIGAEDIRFVVGKARRTSKLSHAWVMWKNEGRWWVLDCTNTAKPIALDTVGSSQYIPLYSWAKDGTYRHSSTKLFANGAVAGKAAVADRR